MEALGVASSIAGLISLADVIAFKISKYYSLVKGAQSEIRQLLLEVQSLYGVLNSLKLLAQCLEDAQPSQTIAHVAHMDHFQTCRHNLDHLKRSLNKLELDPSKPIEVVKTKLLWPFKAAETKELVQKISRNKSDLTEALTADGLGALVKALSSQERLIESVEVVQKEIQRLAIEKAENEQDENRKKLFNWCSSVNPYQKHRTAKSLRHPNTVLWFFESEEWHTWTKEPNYAIWLYGIPGAGKTILTSAAIEEAKALVQDKLTEALAYYYVEYRLPETQKLPNIIGSLIRQLCATSDEAFRELEAYYEKYNPDPRDSISLTEDDLKALMGRVCRCFENVMIIVDGLDEIQDTEDRSNILEMLSCLNTPEYGTIKCIYTSRDEIDIRQQFEHYQSISIAARGNDLELYVAAGIETRMKSRKLRMNDPLLKETIINGIVSKANGMFQYAKCQLDYICTLSTDRERRTALETLPLDLFETYRRILARVSKSTPGNRRLVERTLRWVAVSTDNLPTDAFATAVAVEIGSHCLDPDDIPDEHSILRWCSSLITKDEKLNTLSFSHFTVREFLEDEKLLEIDDLRNFYLDWVDSQTIIAKVCLSYLCMPELSTWVVDSYNDVKNQLDKRPFLNYACKWWTDHTTESKHFEDGTIHDPILFRLICQLFNPAKTNNFILWLHVYWEFSYGKSREIDSDRVVPVPLSASVLHHAAFFGYANVCTWLLEQGADVNLSDPILGTPLLCAIANYHITREGKLNVVKVLLTHGASTRQMQTQHHIFPNYGLPYGTPMLMILDHAKQQPVYACRLFRELLSSNEISNFSTSSFWSNLHGYRGIQPPPPPPPPIVPHSQEFEQPPGAIQRRLTTLEILGRTTEMMAELFRETLNHNASYLLDDESRTKIFTYLLENGKKNTSPEVLSAQITQGNIVDSKISLHIALVAAKNGQTDLIRVFIQEHKDPQVLSNCLPVAAFSGYTEMVDILLEYCLPHVSRTSENILKAWIRAAVAGNVSCLAAFVKYGVDLNSVVRLYDQPDEGLNCATAISNAVSCGMLEAAKYLCSLPDLHLHVKADGLPLLHLAASASKNRQEMIKLLLKTGADPSERSDKGTTPLHHLLASPYDLNAKDLEAVHSLVKNGCDLEAVDNEGSSLLHVLFSWPSYTAMTCFRELSDFIIGTGTMKSCISNDGTLPLQMAIRSRQPSSIIKILLPPDLALWNSVDRRYHSVLHDLFDPRSIERNRRPFYDASSRPVAPLPTFTSEALATLDVLLSTDGINVDVKDPNGNTPLLTMFSNDLQYGHRDYRIKMLKQLLQGGADINACNDDGFTPLHMVIWHGNQEELKEVLLYKPDLNAQTRSGDTAFHLLMGGPNRHVPVQPPSQVVGKLQSIMIYAKEISASSNHDSGRIEGLEIANKRGHLPIHVACEKRNLEAVRFLLNSGYVPDVNIRTLQSRSTPLHFVSCWFEPELSITLDLLDRGADVNATNSMKITPLHDAATAGYLEVLKALIERGARSNVKSRLGYTPWMCAAMNSQSEAMVYLKECAEAEHLNNLDRPLEPKNETREEDDRGSSSSENEDEDQDGDEDNPASDYKGLPKHKIGQKQAMRKALRNSEYGLCQMLLETGFDPNQILTTKNKETALHLATSPDLIRLLLQHGAQVNSVDVWGCEPIHESAREGRHENMKILIKAGAKIDARNYWMTTSLHWAASNDHLETVQAIIELAETESKDRDSKITVQGLLECRNSNGETPFLDALDSCSEKVSKFLFEYGVNVFACDRWGHNALWLACCFADKPFIESLLALGLDINNQTDAGVDCLYNVLDRDVSDQDELVDLALLLINSGARLSSSGSGQSPLHMACFTGNLAIVKELLNRIDPRELSVESRFTGTPLWAACFRGHLEVVKMLLGTGWEFDINLGKNGESPLEAAAVQLHWEVVTILENSGALRTKELQIRPVKVQPSEIITSVGLGEVEV